MALSANEIIKRKQQPCITKLQCVDGALHIYKGALVMYEASNIGYVMVGADSSNTQPEFAGIALEELDVAAADNTADGTYEIEVLPRGCGEEVPRVDGCAGSDIDEGDDA